MLSKSGMQRCAVCDFTKASHYDCQNHPFLSEGRLISGLRTGEHVADTTDIEEIQYVFCPEFGDWKLVMDGDCSACLETIISVEVA